jgi:hypothetical protein
MAQEVRPARLGVDAIPRQLAEKDPLFGHGVDGACLAAKMALAAESGRKRRVGEQCGVRIERAEAHSGAVRRRDEQRGFADPSQTGQYGHRFLTQQGVEGPKRALDGIMSAAVRIFVRLQEDALNNRL